MLVNEWNHGPCQYLTALRKAHSVDTREAQNVQHEAGAYNKSAIGADIG